MRLQRLTGLEREKLLEEYRALQEEIGRLQAILGDETLALERDQSRTSRCREKVRQRAPHPDQRPVRQHRQRGFDRRRAHGGDADAGRLHQAHAALELPRPVTRRARREGAKAKRGRHQLAAVLVGSTHDYLLFFTDRGRVYREKIYDLPEAERAARGNHIRNILPLETDEQVQTVIALKDLDIDGYFVFATRQGIIKRTAIRDYSNINAAGLIAINLVDKDELVAVRTTDGNADIVLATRNGQAIRFEESQARDTGRAHPGRHRRGGCARTTWW